MNGFDPAMMQRMQQLIQQNPQLAMLLQKPGLMQKLQAIAQNPNDPIIAQQYASDPDVQQLMSILGPSMGINNPMNNQATMNNMNFNANNHANQSNIIYIHSENQFLDIITKTDANKLIISYFFATWCGPCKAMSGEYERLASLYKSSAIFMKIDVDKNRNLSQRKKVSAMPTFHFYKNKHKIDEMRGANARKLEDLIIKHNSFDDHNKNKQNNSPSPYTNFPLHESNRPIYTKAPYKKMKDKLKQLNHKFFEDEPDKYSLNSSEWKILTQIVNMLQDRASYASQKFNASHYKLLDKLLTWPSETLPPVLDLIRVLSLHPSFAEYCSQNMHLILKIMSIGGNGLINAVNGMLTCRIIINLFNRRITAKVLEHNYTVIIDNLLYNMMVQERKNTRLAFVRVLLHFAYCFYTNGKVFVAEKIRCLALCSEILYREKDEDVLLNILMGCGTLLFRDMNVIQFAKSLDMIMVFKSYRQKYKNNKQIVTCCSELIQAIENPNL